MPIDCLLGADNCWQFLEGSVIQGEFPGPVAVLSKFGWLLSGPVNVQGNNHLFNQFNFYTSRKLNHL